MTISTLLRSPQGRRPPRGLPVAAAIAAIAALFAAPPPAGRAAPAAQVPPACSWVRLTTGQALMQHTLVEAPAAGALLFGGGNPKAETITDDVWRLDLTGEPAGTWTQLSPTDSGAGPRAEHSAVLRTGSGEMIAFGGIDTVPSGGTFTWRSPLLGGGSAVESRHGAFAAAEVRGDVYRLNVESGAAAWTQVAAGAADGPKLADHSAIYDPVGDAMIVFGGREGEDAATTTHRLWRLSLGDGGTWTSREVAGGPIGRFAHSAVYDPIGKRMIVYGGTKDWKAGLDDVWALDLKDGWDAGAWVDLDPSGFIPDARYDHGAVFVAHLNWMLIWGGSIDGQNELDSLHALDLSGVRARWIEIEPRGSQPEAVRAMAAAYHAATNTVIFQGGIKGAETSALAWGLRCGDAAPTSTTTTAATTAASPTATGATTIAPTFTATPTSTSMPTASPTGHNPTMTPAGIYLPRLLKKYP